MIIKPDKLSAYLAATASWSTTTATEVGRFVRRQYERPAEVYHMTSSEWQTTATAILSLLVNGWSDVDSADGRSRRPCKASREIAEAFSGAVQGKEEQPI